MRYELRSPYDVKKNHQIYYQVFVLPQEKSNKQYNICPQIADFEQNPVMSNVLEEQQGHIFLYSYLKAIERDINASIV